MPGRPDRCHHTAPVSADDAAEFIAACELRSEFGMPQHVFAKVPGEHKPLYVNWAAPLLVRQLFRMTRGIDGTVEFSEMLPDPDQRWLRLNGQRLTSELRCSVFSVP